MRLKLKTASDIGLQAKGNYIWTLSSVAYLPTPIERGLLATCQDSDRLYVFLVKFTNNKQI